jgi:hypothetical protein
MTHLCPCKNEECSKKDQCLRFNIENPTACEIDFKQICNESNNYKHFEEMENKIQPTT